MSKTKGAIQELATIIKANPGCIAIVDNDCWTLYKLDPYRDNAPEDDDDGNELANSTANGGFDNGYGSGNCYGGDILQALALIVGIKVESV